MSKRGFALKQRLHAKEDMFHGILDIGWAAGVDRLSLLVEATNKLALSMSVAVR